MRPDAPRLHAATPVGQQGEGPTTRDEDQALTVICRLAAQALDADDASIEYVVAGRSTARAATSDRARQAERLLGFGDQGPSRPCPELGDTIRIDELGAQPRWPDGCATATRDLGIHSVLAHFVQFGGSGRAVLAVYASQPASFTRADEATLTAFGMVAAAVIGAGLDRQRADHLQHALHTNRRIGAAIGVIMATQHVDLEEGWQLLSAASQHLNSKVVDVAEQVIYTGTLPTDGPGRAAHGSSA